MKRLFIGLFFCLSISSIGCAPLGPPLPWTDFDTYIDGPIPDEVRVWLNSGDQSNLSEKIILEAATISGGNRREKLYRAMDYIWRTFSYDNWLNTEAFQRTAEEIFEDRKLGGCSDFALVEMTFFRAVGIPSRLVMTANVDWIFEYQRNDESMSEGHSFIEVFLEDKWYLVDSTYRWLFSDYELKSPFYPHGEYLCKKGKDFWDIGIRNIADLNSVMRRFAEDYTVEFVEPSYGRQPI